MQEHQRSQIGDGNLTEELLWVGDEIEMTEQIPGAPVGLKRPQPTSDWKMVNPKHVHFHNQMVFPHQDW